MIHKYGIEFHNGGQIDFQVLENHKLEVNAIESGLVVSVTDATGAVVFASSGVKLLYEDNN